MSPGVADWVGSLVGILITGYALWWLARVARPALRRDPPDPLRAFGRGFLMMFAFGVWNLPVALASIAVRQGLPAVLGQEGPFPVVSYAVGALGRLLLSFPFLPLAVSNALGGKSWGYFSLRKGFDTARSSSGYLKAWALTVFAFGVAQLASVPFWPTRTLEAYGLPTLLPSAWSSKPVAGQVFPVLFLGAASFVAAHTLGRWAQTAFPEARTPDADAPEATGATIQSGA